MAQRAIVARYIALGVVLVVPGMGVMFALRLLLHLMSGLLVVLAARAKRHHVRGVALQRQPQHEADQEQFAR